MARIGFLLLFAALLMGCSPDYNWRDVKVAGGAVEATFPDTPQIHTREFNFSGHQIEFTLTVAKVNGALFAVGYASLPEALQKDEPARNELGREVVRSFYRSSGLADPALLPSWGDRFSVQGNSPKGPVTLQARVWVLPHALVEAMVTADASAFPQQQADDFLRSLVVAR